MSTRFLSRLSLSGLVFLLAFCVGCGVPDADGPADTFGLDFSLPPGSDTNSTVVFLVDGLNAEIFDQMLQAGELPAIRKYFLDRGLYCPRTVVNTPSVTLANETSVVTGVFPGHHGVTGINWFDRNRLIWRNYETIAQKNTLDCDYIRPTIYERLQDRTTISVFYQAHRGATKFIENWTSAGPPFFFGWYEFVDRLTLSRFDLVMEIARRRREMPAFTMVYQLTPDFRAYAKGIESPEYRQALRETDYQLGRVLSDMERAGLLDKIHIALMSDHGMIEVTRHIPMTERLKGLELALADKRLWERDGPFEERQEYYQQFNCVQYGSGYRYLALQFRKPVSTDPLRYADWTHRPTAEQLAAYPTGNWPGRHKPWYRCDQPDRPLKRLNLLKLFAEWDEIDAIAYAVGENRVRVRRASGEVEFRQDGGRGEPIGYRVVSGEDPLGWSASLPAAVQAGKRALGEREWLAATAGTDYPDLPAQIVAYFRAARAGDIVLFAAPGWDFSDNLRAGHGGLRPAEAFTPMLLAGPGVPHKQIDVARTVDLAPTLLHLLGRDAPDEFDGKPLLPRRE
ncbi:MAG: alkaline phosphatase family protein [Phycisphaerae bacterium]